MNMKVAASQIGIPVSVSSGSNIAVNLGAAYQPQAGEIYEGPFEFTPGDEEQTIATEGKSVTENIIINAIPTNYGKVSWDGAIINIT